MYIYINMYLYIFTFISGLRNGLQIRCAPSRDLCGEWLIAVFMECPISFTRYGDTVLLTIVNKTQGEAQGKPNLLSQFENAEIPA